MNETHCVLVFFFNVNDFVMKNSLYFVDLESRSEPVEFVG